LEHALIYALVEIADPRATSIGLAADSAEVRRGALIALDQMDGSALTREQVVPLLDTGDGALQRSAIAILARHPEWSVDLLDAIHPWLQEPALSEERAATIRGSLVALAEEPRTEAFLAEGLASPSTSISARLLLLDVVARSGRESLPGGWVEGIRRAMSAPDLATRLAAIEATRDHPSDFTGDLTNIARDASVESRTRQSAARRLAAMGGAIDDSLWPTLVAQLSSETPPLDRMAVAEAIGQAGLSSSQREELIEHIGLAGPVELPALLSAFERPPFTSKEGESLADALAAAPGFVNLSARRVEDLFARHSSELRPRAELLVRTLRENQSARVELLDVIGSIVPRASAERGRALFAGTKSACSSCHQVAGQGGRIGPDLSKIGGSRDVRSLVESVVLPSMSFARGYESFNIVTDDGRSFTGVIARESLEDLWIRTADRSEIRLARRQIEEFSASQRSMMPEGLDKLLAPEELADIVAYLISLK
jgi:putative heme-binding domain-containing protein